MEGKRRLFRKGSVKALIFEKLQEGMSEDGIVKEVIEKSEMTEEEVCAEIKAVKAAKVR